MKKLIYLITIYFPILLFGQEIKPLTIGDKIPDVVFDKMLNHKTSKGKLSDFKGKAIIIDMWFRENPKAK